MSQLLQTKLKIPEELSTSIIQNGELNIVRLIELYGPEGALGDYVEQAHRHFVLSICALVAYMLIPTNEGISPSLVSIALQMDARKNIMPIILAETLMGLDLVKSGQAGWFSGCPLLLQSEDIVWRCPWLNLSEMTVSSAGFKRVVLAGLTSFTFYIPGRTLRQLGTNQENRRFGREHFELPTFENHNLLVYEYSWNNRELEEPLLDSITWLESRYVKWLHKKVKARLGGFGDNELCPTVEEFQAYLQGFASNVIVVPPYRKSMSKLLKTSLNITTGAAESLLSGGLINIMRLMEWHGPEGDNGDIALQARHRFALVISVLAAYLLVSPNGEVAPSLLWLSDKLGLTAASEANWPRMLGWMHQRRMLYPEMTTEEWCRFMNEMSPQEIVWRHEALGIPDMALNSAGFERMVIAGLSSFTFYIPGRILRQLGISQGSHRAGVESFHILALTAQNLMGPPP
ncbi:hypothetical protein RHMOL_Rhmol06G0114600 [Rhododendron molle]|uniref:Uncharacterized protein n=1 Tax=Rhododendron molle TaxID=49168 RepID=A0ACC0NCC1_RHOML|nr:hypothetical protein RHMOL_Rhmol06G0114600 [Rhododendron molle]